MKNYENCKGCNANSPKEKKEVVVCSYCGQGLTEVRTEVRNNVAIVKGNGNIIIQNAKSITHIQKIDIANFD